MFNKSHLEKPIGGSPADIADAIAKKHAAVTLDSNADTLLSLSTQALGLDTKAANIVFAGPVTGAATIPAFRSLVEADINFKKPYHGIESIGALSFSNADHILTIATGITYWFSGVQKVITGVTTCDIDGIAGGIVARTLYWFYFDDTSGTLKVATTINLRTQVPVATVYWNGAAGAVQREYHNHTRDIDWHLCDHMTYGCRYKNDGGFAQTYPSVGTPASLQIEIGTLYDEDLSYTTGQITNMRGWYKYDVNSYTFTDYSLPYLGGGANDPYWLDTDDYTLKSVDDGKYVCFWVYGSLDNDRPLYVFPTHAAGPYNTIALARAEAIPNLIALGMNAEIKLLYRWIYKGDGAYQERTDYRTSSSVPSGGVQSIAASSVSSLAHGDVAATNVQAAIEELADEKLSLAGGTMTGNIIMPDGGTIGQAAGPLLTFDDTNNYLEITGANVGIGTATPTALFTINKDGLGNIQAPATVNASALVLENNTTVSSAVREAPPYIVFKGHGWSGTADVIMEHAILSDPMNNNNPTFRVYVRKGGAWTQILGIDSIGQFSTALKFNTYDSKEVVTLGGQLGNDAASTALTDQYSPYYKLAGSGWKTDATAASRPMSAGVVVAPEKGAANPIGVLKFFYGTNTSTPVEANELYRLEWGDRLGFIINSLGIANYVTAILSGLHVGGTSDPGDNNLLVDGLTTTTTIKITGGSPGANKVLTSDADGDATWETSYVHPNHSGDVTSVADGAQTIAAEAVTYAKMQHVSATDKVLGRFSGGAGDVEEIACTAAGRALLDDANAAAQMTTLGADLMIKGDGTAGRVLKAIYCRVQDGTNASTIKCNTASLFNGDVIGVTDNIGKTASPVGNFTLDASGSSLRVEVSGLTGNCVGVLGFGVRYNDSALTITSMALANANDIQIDFSNSAGAVDITTIAAGKIIDIWILYLTSA